MPQLKNKHEEEVSVSRLAPTDMCTQVCLHIYTRAGAYASCAAHKNHAFVFHISICPVLSEMRVIWCETQATVHVCGYM